MAVRYRRSANRALALLVLLTIMSVFVPVLPALGETAAAGPVQISIEQAITITYEKDPAVRKSAASVEGATATRDKSFDVLYWRPTSGWELPGSGSIEAYTGFLTYDANMALAKKLDKLQPNTIAKKMITAYTAALKDQNNLQQARMELSVMEKQIAVKKLSRDLGQVSEVDWAALENGLVLKQQAVKAYEDAASISMLNLIELMNGSRSSVLQLMSHPIPNPVKKGSLEYEVSQASNDAVSVWTQESAVNLETLKQPLVTPSIPSKVSQANVTGAQADLETAKRDARIAVETLYYGIEAKEKTLKALNDSLVLAQKNLGTAETKYRLGMIPWVNAGIGPDLASSRLEVEKAKIAVENTRADIVKYKADLYYITNRKVYDAADWNLTPDVAVNASAVITRPEASEKITFKLGSTTNTIGSRSVKLDTAPYQKQGKTYVPIRALGDALGAKVDYNKANNTVTLTKTGKTVVLTIGNRNAMVNGRPVINEAAPESVKGRIMLPARVVVEGLGGSITWNADTREVVIYK
ncbi:MAG: stalk domain-containing protein [Solirubrobacterales bacterium]